MIISCFLPFKIKQNFFLLFLKISSPPPRPQDFHSFINGNILQTNFAHYILVFLFDYTPRNLNTKRQIYVTVIN